MEVRDNNHNRDEMGGAMRREGETLMSLLKVS